MRKIIAITQVSLDGVMQAPGGPEEDPSNGFRHGGWAMPFGSEVGRRIIGEIVGGEFDLLLGRRTYDIWNSYWPNNGNHPIGQAFNKATKYVVTHRSAGLSWAKSELIGGDIVERIRQLKATSGADLHLWGSSEVFQAMVGGGLIDEHRLLVFPIVLGQGKRLFAGGAPRQEFTLVSTKTTPTGVLYNTYQPATRHPH